MKVIKKKTGNLNMCNEEDYPEKTSNNKIYGLYFLLNY